MDINDEARLERAPEKLCEDDDSPLLLALEEELDVKLFEVAVAAAAAAAVPVELGTGKATPGMPLGSLLLGLEFPPAAESGGGGWLVLVVVVDPMDPLCW